jgi:glucose-6-phosphate isomerase
LPAYLQQLEMESNGKRVDRDGNPLPYNTGTIIWGEPGSNAQHSFFQLLHQGTMQFTADFVAPADARSGLADQHRQGLANMLAQAEAFARGHPPEAVGREMQVSGIAADEIARLVNHKVHPGNHASNIILCRRLTPATLGGLVAMYEHKVFVQAVIWGINPFDQWGVELGKRMAGPMHQQLDGAIPTTLPIIGIIRDWSAARDD